MTMPNFLEGKVTLLAAALFILVSCSFPVPRKEMKPSATPVKTPALPTGESILSTPETEQDIQPSPEDEVALWKEYNNPYFKVNLRYPADWEHQDGEPSYGERFGSQQGFFTITAMGGPGLTLDQPPNRKPSISSNLMDPTP